MAMRSTEGRTKTTSIACTLSRQRRSSCGRMCVCVMGAGTMIAGEQVNALLMAPPVPALKRFVAEKYPPPATFTGAPYLDPDTETVAEILEFAHRAEDLKENGYLPVPIFTMKTGTEEEIAQLKKQIDNTSMCIIRGLNKEVKKVPSLLAPAGENNLLSCSYESIGGSNKLKITVILAQSAKHKSKLYEYKNWPSEADCVQHGIPVQKFIQKPGGTVYVGIGTYHWLQSLGITTNVSWNVGHTAFNRLAHTDVINENYIANSTIPLIGLETTMWNMIMDKSVELDQPTKAIVKRILLRSLFKAKRDYKHPKKEKLQVIYDDDKELNPVERCFNMKCRAELFNLIPLVSAKDIPEVIRMQDKDTDAASPVIDIQENSFYTYEGARPIEYGLFPKPYSDPLNLQAILDGNEVNERKNYYDYHGMTTPYNAGHHAGAMGAGAITAGEVVDSRSETVNGLGNLSCKRGRRKQGKRGNEASEREHGWNRFNIRSGKRNSRKSLLVFYAKPYSDRLSLVNEINDRERKKNPR
ncbi:unnamed protein product [Caenorhabditis nigoni]